MDQFEILYYKLEYHNDYRNYQETHVIFVDKK